MNTITNAVSSTAKIAANAVWGEGTTDGAAAQEPTSGASGNVSKGEPFDAGNKDVMDEPTSTSATTGTTAPISGGDASHMQADAGNKQESLDAKTAEQRMNVDNSGGVDDSTNPAKVEGPGPKTVEELAREHGGDAGATGAATTGGETMAGEKNIDSSDPNAPSTGEGTGEQYIKSSGLAADGGDFDATRPGAGREADRLLEEKGMANPTKTAKENAAAEAHTSTAPETHHEKVSMKDKIKAKLHMNKK